MRILTRFAVISSLGAMLLAACSNQLDDNVGQAQGDAYQDASGVAETVTAGLGAEDTYAIHVISPSNNKNFELAEGASGVVVVMTVATEAPVGPGPDDVRIRYYEDGAELEIVTHTDPYMFLGLTTGRHHLCAELVDQDDVALPGFGTISCVYVRVQGVCSGVGDDAACDDGFTCSAQSCGSEGICKYGSAPGACCDHDVECLAGDNGKYCIDNTCAECVGDAECEDGLFCTQDSCGADGFCIHEKTADCCEVQADCNDGLFCTTDSCDVVNKTCVHEPSELSGCCNFPGAFAEECKPEDPCTAYLCYANNKKQLQYCRYGPERFGCCVDDSMCEDNNPCTLDVCNFDQGDTEETGTCTHIDDPQFGGSCCIAKSQCDDFDDSTIDDCVSNTCVHTADPTYCQLPDTSNIVITEIMMSPGSIPDGAGEWIEIYNTLDTPIDIAGWTLENSVGDTHVIDPANTIGKDVTTLVFPGEYYMLARFDDPALDNILKPHYVYGEFFELPDPHYALDPQTGPAAVALRNGAGELMISVSWDPNTWDIQAGRSMELVHTHADYSLPASWKPAGYSVTPGFNKSYSASVEILGSPRGVNLSSYHGIPTASCQPDDPSLCAIGVCNLESRCDTAIGAGCCTEDAHCADANACTVSTCNTVANICSAPVEIDNCCTADLDCEDGNPCNLDRCLGAKCRYSDNIVPGCCVDHVDCDDEDACTIDACDFESGSCLPSEAFSWPTGELCCNDHIDCDDGDVQTADECVDNKCVYDENPLYCLTTTDCDADPNPCKEVFCDPLSSECTTFSSPGCCVGNADCTGDDGNACTDHACNTETNTCFYEWEAGCCNANDADADAQCDDEEPCTLDVCINGTCHNTPQANCCYENTDCDDSVGCTVDLCVDNQCTNDPIQGCCTPGPAGDPTAQVQCGTMPEDAPSCGVWECLEGGICSIYDPGNCCDADVDCNDNSQCTADLCQEDHTCKYVPQPLAGCCTLHSDCQESEYCAVTGLCTPKKPDGEVCDESVECTSDKCADLVQAVTVEIDENCFDLDGPAILNLEGGNCPAGSDFRFAVVAGQLSLLPTGASAGIAGYAFDDLHVGDIPNVTLTGNPVSLSEDDVLVVQTPEAAFFKILIADHDTITGEVTLSVSHLDVLEANADGTRICMPKSCDGCGCADDSDCASGACVLIDDIGVCCASDPLLNEPCDSDDADQCAKGTWTCTADALGRECVNETATDIAEICDDIDNNCDGTIDEGYPTKGDSCGVGACEGGQLECNAFGSGLRCDTAPGGSNDKSFGETCDGEDNDCDGQADENIAIVPDASLTDGVCEGALKVCSGAGGWVDPDYSQITLYQAIETQCDGKDNDCNGEVDNDLIAPDASLTLGVCANSRQICYGAGGWQDPNFSAIEGYEVAELECDGKDNDCDGLIDEDLVAPVASKTAGVCAGSVKICNGVSGWQEPNYFDIPGYEQGNEVSCDGIDNNCSGIADNTMKIGQGCDGDDNDSCEDGIRVCAADGSVFCDESGDPVEVCDGKDNDCDGEADEDFHDDIGPKLGDTCDSDDSDQCELGYYECLDNGAIGCIETQTDIEETCDGEDNDCDGAIDEDGVCNADCVEIAGGWPILDCTITGDTSPDVWTGVGFEGTVDAGPLGEAEFTGNLFRDGATQDAYWTVGKYWEADVSNGLAYLEVDYEIEHTNGGSTYGTFTGDVTVDSGTATGCTGTFTVDEPWSSTIECALLPLRSCAEDDTNGFVLRDVTMTLAEYLPHMGLTANLVVDMHGMVAKGLELPEPTLPGGPFEAEIDFDEFNPNIDFEVPVRQLFGTSYFPLRQSDTYSVEDLAGVWRSVDGSYRLDLDNFKERVAIMSWLGIDDMTTEIVWDEQCQYSLTFDGDLDLGVFGDMDIEGAFSAGPLEQLTGSLDAFFERNLLGIIILTNGNIHLEIDEEKINVMTWSADVNFVGLDFNVTGWFEISAEGELYRACMAIEELPLAFGGLELLTVEDLTVCLPVDCSNDGLAIGGCNGSRKRANVQFVFDTSAYDSGLGANRSVDDEEFVPYLDTFFATSGLCAETSVACTSDDGCPEGVSCVGDEHPLGWEFVQPALPKEPTVQKDRYLAYLVAMQTPLQHFAVDGRQWVNPTFNFTPAFKGNTFSPGCYEGAVSPLTCGCEEGAIVYDADPGIPAGLTGGACLQFSPAECGEADECCTDGSTCTAGVCVGGFAVDHWMDNYFVDPESPLPIELTPQKAAWPYYRDWALGKNTVWGTTPTYQRPKGGTGRYSALAYGLHTSAKALLDDSLLYDLNDQPGQLGGACLNESVPGNFNSQTDDDPRCPGLEFIDPPLSCVNSVCRDKANPGPWENLEGDGFIVLIANDDEECKEFPAVKAQELAGNGIPTYVIGWPPYEGAQVDDLSAIAVAGGHAKDTEFPDDPRYHKVETVADMEQAIADAMNIATCDGIADNFPGCSVTFDGRLTFLPSFLGAGAPIFDVDGFFIPNSDWELNVELVEPWEVIPGFGPTVSDLNGSLGYIEFEETYFLDVEATAPTMVLVPDLLELNDTTVTARITDQGAWEYTLAGLATLPLFGEVQLDGNIQKLSKNAPITGCLSGVFQDELDLLGAVKVRDLSVTFCFDDIDLDEYQLQFAGEVDILGLEAITASGELTVDHSKWELDLEIANLNLDIINIELLKLKLEKNGTDFEVFGRFSVPGLNALQVDLQGFYDGYFSYEWTLSLQEGTTWTPLSFAPDLVFTDLTGTIKRGDGETEITVSATTPGPWVLVPGVELEPVTVGGTYRRKGGTVGWGFSIGGTLTLGPFGELEIYGELNQDGPGQPVYGTLEGTFENIDFLGMGFLTFQPLQIGVDFSGNSLEKIRLAGDLSLLGGQYTFTGEYIPGPPWRVTLNIDEIDLGIAILTDVTLSYSDGSGKFGILAETGLNLGGNISNFLVDGDLELDGDYTLALGLKEGDIFNPLPQFGLSFSSIGAELKKVGNDLSGYIEAGTDVQLMVVPGFTIQDVFVRADFYPNSDNWKFSINGTTTITFGDEGFTLIVSAEVDTTGNLKFTGIYEGNLQPFKTIIGNGKFVLEGATVTVQINNDDSFEITLATLATLQVQGKPFSMAVSGGYKTKPGQTPTYYLGGTIPSIDIPGLGATPEIFFVVTNKEIKAFDLFYTPDDPTDDIKARKGLTLGTLMASPVPLTEFESELTFLIYIDLENPSNLRVEANIPLDWTIIDKDTLGGIFQNIDVERVHLKTIKIFIDITGSNFAIGFGAELDFNPVDHPVLYGVVEISVDVQLNLELFAFLEGQWREPFDLRNFTIQDPGFTIGLRLSSGIPTPKSLGANIDIYWLKEGEWPPMDEQVVPVPGSIKQVGGTFFFDTEITTSGLCLFGGGCLPLPTLALRATVIDMSFPGDALNMQWDLAMSVNDKFGGFLPDIEFPEIDWAPLEIDVHELNIRGATHDLTIFNQEFFPGFEGIFDANLFGLIDVVLTGYLSADQLRLTAEVQPFTLLGVNFTGNPFSRFAYTGDGGTVQVGHDARLNTSQFTVEGHVKREQWFGGPSAGTLVRKMDGANGFQVAVGSADPETGKAHINITVKNGGVERTLSSKNAVVPANEWAHIAVAFDSDESRVTAYKDGKFIRLLDSGPEIYPGANGASMFWGAGMDIIDDVRFWNVIRTPAQIRGEADVLPTNHYEFSSLVGRWDFDFDVNKEGDLESAYNRKLYTSGNRMHGDYVGGASNILDDNQSMFFGLTYAANILDSGFEVRAGLDVDIPVLDDLGIWNPSAMVQAKIGLGEFSGEFYVSEFVLLPIPLLGDFLLSGDGPNMNPNDFDDGLFGAFNITYYEIFLTAAMKFDSPWISEPKRFVGAQFKYYCPEDKYPSCSPLTNQLFIRFDLDLLFSFGSLGDWGIIGSAEFDSAGPHFLIEGSLTIVSQELLAGAILIDDEHINLTTTFDLPTIYGFDFGKIEVEADLRYEPFRLCIVGTADFNIPVIDGAINAAVGYCIGHDPYFLLHGSASTGNIIGFQLHDLSATVAFGNVPNDLMPPGYDVIQGFQVHAKLTFAGLLLIEFTGIIQTNGQFEFSATTTLTFAGHTLASVDVLFNNSGIKLSTFISILGVTISVTGELYTNGTFSLTGSIDIKFLGVTFASAAVTVNNSYIRVEAMVDVVVIEAHLMIEIQTNGSWKLDIGGKVVIAGFTLAGVTMKGSGTGLDIKNFELCGEVNLGFQRVKLCGSPSIPAFSLTAKVNLQYKEFKLLAVDFDLSNAGLFISGEIDIKVFKVFVSGKIEPCTAFNLTGTANVSLFGFNASVAVTVGKSCAVFGFYLSGTISASVLGQSLYGSFSFNFNTGAFSFCAGANIGANLPKIPYPCIKISCNTVCVPYPCVTGCLQSLYGVCIIPKLGICQACATVCLPIPAICYYNLGFLGCSLTMCFDQGGLKDPFQASCSVPILGGFSASISASCGKVCVSISVFGITASVCTPCFW